MRDARFQMTHLSDYQRPSFIIDTVDLVFDLHDDYTLVTNSMQCQRSTDASDSRDFILNGNDLELVKLSLNGESLSPHHYKLTDNNLTLLNPPKRFSVVIITKIYPEKNSQLSGLYKSNALYCTQNEAEGFRRITYFLDRPDVLSIYTTKIIASKKNYPTLLSNGNLIQSGEMEGDRHWVKWHDPFKKPCYLYALVAGKLVSITDHFETRSGRRIALKIFVEPGNEHKCHHAMQSLKQAMKWDEDTYGREYDLDIYMIVAVSHFNAGAMENKGLNIFNSQYVLAQPETATDADYLHIQSVVAHEYFHNWSGNRVTCRDWFQLSLKEGLTVFRDQEFSRDLNSRDVMRIKDVQNLRALQFPEDAGPMAHPVRPQSYMEINNFYTMTVYEKGAEVIRMLYTLLGKEVFFKGMDEYFRRYDGKAVTTDDFVKAHEIASGRDLTHFKLWYDQAGTPTVTIKTDYNASKKTYTLHLTQKTSPTPGQKTKKPLVIPIHCTMYFSDDPSHSQPIPLIELDTEKKSITLTDIPTLPILSVLQDFSAPINLDYSREDSELQFLLAYDENGFCKWEAGQELAIRILLNFITNTSRDKEISVSEDFLSSYQRIIDNDQTDFLLKSKLFDMPSIQYLLDKISVVDIDSLHFALKSLRRSIGNYCLKSLEDEYQKMNDGHKYSIDKESTARRAWKNTCLDYLMLSDPKAFVGTCMNQFKQADNMTDAITALSALVDHDLPERNDALNVFYEKWQHEELVINKWFSIQARADRPDVIDTIKKLINHQSFDMKNPNKVRALIGAFCMGNHKYFHANSGEGYAFLADHIIQLDALNPQVAARLANAFSQWRKFDKNRQMMMKSQLSLIKNHANLSKNVFEMVTKSLGE